MPVQHDRREVLREFPINILPQDMPYGTSNASIEHFLCRSLGGYGYDIICEFSYNTVPAFFAVLYIQLIITQRGKFLVFILAVCTI